MQWHLPRGKWASESRLGHHTAYYLQRVDLRGYYNLERIRHCCEAVGNLMYGAVGRSQVLGRLCLKVVQARCGMAFPADSSKFDNSAQRCR